MIKLGLISLVSLSLVSLAQAAAPDVASSSQVTDVTPVQKTTPLGDNPNLFRVFAYKTGQGISELGQVIEQSADDSSAQISKTWQQTQPMREQSSTNARSKLTQAKQYTKSKFQSGKDAVLGSRDTPVPIERGALSETSAIQN